MNAILKEARIASLSRRIRNAIVRVARDRDATICRGPCGLMDACGAHWEGWYPVQGELCGGQSAQTVVRLAKTGKLCPVCAVLSDREYGTNYVGDIEEEFGAVLSMTPEEVVGFLQGWDGDSAVDTENSTMFMVGRRLARELVEEVEDEAH